MHRHVSRQGAPRRKASTNSALAEDRGGQERSQTGFYPPKTEGTKPHSCDTLRPAPALWTWLGSAIGDSSVSRASGRRRGGCPGTGERTASSSRSRSVRAVPAPCTALIGTPFMTRCDVNVCRRSCQPSASMPAVSGLLDRRPELAGVGGERRYPRHEPHDRGRLETDHSPQPGVPRRPDHQTGTSGPTSGVLSEGPSSPPPAARRVDGPRAPSRRSDPPLGLGSGRVLLGSG